MSTQTTNLNLILPDMTDYALITDINNNFTTLDTVYGGIQDADENVIEAITVDGVLQPVVSKTVNISSTGASATLTNHYVSSTIGDEITDTDIDDSGILTETYSDYISKWDALVTNHNRFTKDRTQTVRGAYSMYWYKLSSDLESDVGTTSSGNNNSAVFSQRWKGLPTILIIAGLHGNEKHSMAALYLFVKRLLEYEDHELVRNYNWYICPCANPTGYDLNTRNNSEGVNLNRNFKYGWDDYTPSSSESKGDSAMDQKETQNVVEVFTAFEPYSDHTLILDLHDFILDDGSATAHNMWAWWTAKTPELRIMEQGLGHYLCSQFPTKYPGVAARVNHSFDWSQYAKNPTLDWYAYMRGFRWESLVESPAYCLANTERLSNTGVHISYQIVGNTINQLAQLVRDNYSIKTNDMEYPDDFTIIDIIEHCPLGDSQTYCSSTSGYNPGAFAELPGNYAGVLHINKVMHGNNYIYYYLQFISTAKAEPLIYYTTGLYNGTATSLKNWILVQGADIHNTASTSNLENWLKSCPDGDNHLYVSTSKYPNIYSDMPISHPGIIKACKCSEVNGYYYYLLEYTDTGYTTPTKYTTTALQNDNAGTFTLHTWKQVTLT